MKNFSNPTFLLNKIQRWRRHLRLNSAKNISTENSRRDWKCAVGLEIHAQLSTDSKLFSSAAYKYTAPTNGSVNLFDASIPGTLPSLNKKAVELAVSSALAFGCSINEVSFFDRKHYFYPDMPCGYQITQQRLPIAENGAVEFAVYQPGLHGKPLYKVSKIKQIQLEQDSGKSMHDSNENQCFIDLNRAGNALIEIVFHPDLEHEEEAGSLVKEVKRILERVQSCSCKLEEGALRIDANVSVHKSGQDLGVRTEIKNIGSIHGAIHAIKYEKNRQIDIIERGGKVKNETLMWDVVLNKTILMREKEDGQDYRFMPEPNLPPLRVLIDDSSMSSHRGVYMRKDILDLRHLKKQIPILPQEDRVFLMENYGLDDVSAYNVVNIEKLLNYFKDIMSENSSRNPKLVYNILFYKFLNGLKANNIDLKNCTIPAWQLGQIVDLLQKKRISKMTVEFLINELLSETNTLGPFDIVEKMNLEIISNPRELRKYCLKIIEREVALVASYKKRKKSVFNELVKKVIEETKYRADTQVLPSVMTEVLAEMFDKDH